MPGATLAGLATVDQARRFADAVETFCEVLDCTEHEIRSRLCAKEVWIAHLPNEPHSCVVFLDGPPIVLDDGLFDADGPLPCPVGWPGPARFLLGEFPDEPHVEGRL